MPTRVLIVGTSTRAAAESAARAGFDVTALDAYADLDQHPSVRALSLPRDFRACPTAPAGARAARTIESDAVAYLSSFENHPRAVTMIAAGRTLWGNPAKVVCRVRDPVVVSDTLRRRGFDVPRVRLAASAGDANDGEAWMVKPFRSGGGHRVRQWRGAPVQRTEYLQEFIDGIPGSVVFAAAAGHTVPLGVSRQLVGDPAFGARAYRYCGSLLAAADDPQFPGGHALIDRACALARLVGEEFGLAGVNGIDFVARDNTPYPVEVNPRWSASMELVEQCFGLSVFGAHAAACARDELPSFDFGAASRGVGAIGKAIIFARHASVIGDTRAWLGDASVRDVPRPGERIDVGHPVCTVFATAPDATRCYQALVQRSERLYEELADWTAGRAIA
jgi:predicted ATP-grasp superfamily ATP-dependent carboligase